MNGELAFRPVVFGEVLFDEFPDGARVLGGAPFNMAWHLHHFGAQPLMITRVGNDEGGREILERMREAGMDLDGVQLDEQHGTGLVRVALNNGQPTFDIVADRAYDHIAWEPLRPLLQSSGERLLLCHGSLAARNAISAENLARLIELVRPYVFVDINLRPPWWDLTGVRRLLRTARWLKLNEEEVRLLEPSDGDLVDAARTLLRPYHMAAVVVTRGEEGALCCSSDGSVIQEPAPQVARFVDAVGAGDAFSAVFVLGQLADWPLETTLRRAVMFAAEICQSQGATNAPPALYETLRRGWDLV